ncbi:hypothetical protein [Siphonobacter curvatus]|nr:hypothetical protein [Siphonobacter curvatus]
MKKSLLILMDTLHPTTIHRLVQGEIPETLAEDIPSFFSPLLVQ